MRVSPRREYFVFERSEQLKSAPELRILGQMLALVLHYLLEFRLYQKELKVVQQSVFVRVHVVYFIKLE